MTNLDWLNNVKKADGDVDEAIEKVKSELFVDNKAIARVIIEYRKIKALEIIAEELILAVRELKVLTKAVKGKI